MITVMPSSFAILYKCSSTSTLVALKKNEEKSRERITEEREGRIGYLLGTLVKNPKFWVMEEQASLDKIEIYRR